MVSHTKEIKEQKLDRSKQKNITDKSGIFSTAKSKREHAISNNLIVKKGALTKEKKAGIVVKAKRPVKLITTKLKKSNFAPRVKVSDTEKPSRNAKVIAETLLSLGSPQQKTWSDITPSRRNSKTNFPKIKNAVTGQPKPRGRPRKHTAEELLELVTLKQKKEQNKFKHSKYSRLKSVNKETKIANKLARKADVTNSGKNVNKTTKKADIITTDTDRDDDDDIKYMLVEDANDVPASETTMTTQNTIKPIEVLCRSNFQVANSSSLKSTPRSLPHCKPSIVKPVPRIPISPYTGSPSSAISQPTPDNTPQTTTQRRTTRSTPGGAGSRSCTPSLLPINPSPVKHIATIAGDYSGKISILSPVKPVNLSTTQLAPPVSKRLRSGGDSDTSSLVERRLSVRQTESAFKYKEIVVKKMYNFTQVILSCGSNQSGLNPQAFNELTQVMNNAKHDDTRLLVLTGSGATFTTGLDLSYLTTGDVKQAAETMALALSDFIHQMIMFPKPIVAAVNGQAIGWGVAILPLCDIVYASDKATFFTPYAQLGQTPEACLSCTLSNVIGIALANEMMLAGRMLTALEAYQMGLVAQVFWPTSMMGEVTPRLVNMAACSGKILNATKALIRSQQKERLLAANQQEAKMLADIWPTAECQKSMKAFLEHRSDILT